MPEVGIIVRRSHSLPLAVLRGRIEHAIRAAEQRHHVAWRWSDGALEVFPPPGLARGARGRLEVSDRDVRVEVHLPLTLRPARRVVEARLASGLDALLRA